MEPKRVKKKPYKVKPPKKHGDKYMCVLCGYIYDEAEQGVKFAELPDNYRCPLCLAGKEYFKKV